MTTAKNPDTRDGDSELQRVFEVALKAPTQQRGAVLDRECAHDPVLRQRVERLLRAHGQESGVLEHPLPHLTPRPPAVEGDRIGPYRILRQIGEGGFGVVYLAEQHTPIHRRVAVKVLGRFTTDAVERFHLERQAQATLEHECIARLYDTGETEAGYPYIVMEYVDDAMAITMYADRASLSLEDRLTLVARVCEGVNYAHEHELIHRDLKPSNILVAGGSHPPRVKIIDFGIARQSRVELSPVATGTGQLLGTPSYMSPEQLASPADVSVRSDVYSLGAILYELICSKPPFPLESDYGTWCDRVRYTDPARPSKVLSLRLRGHSSRTTLAPGRMRELDWLILRALAKDPKDRYRSAAELRDDIGRYLSGAALTAGPPSRTYRLRKFVRRHKAPVVLASVLGIVILASVLLAGVLLSRSVAHAAATQEKQDQIDATQEFSRLVLNVLDPLGESGGSKQAVLAGIDAAIEVTDARFAADPRVRPELLGAIGSTLRSVGRNELAEPCLLRAFELARERIGRDSPVTWHAAHELAFAKSDMGDLEEAEDLIRTAIAEQSRLLGEEADEVISSIQLLGVILLSQSRLAEARDVLEDALQRARTKWGPEAARTAIVENNIAGVFKRQDHLSEAMQHYAHAAAVLVVHLGEEHPQVLSVKSNLAGAMSLAGDVLGAHALLVDLVPQCQRILGDDHPQTLRSMNNLAAEYANLGRYEEAERWYTEALIGQERVLGYDHEDVVATVANLGIVYYQRGSSADLEQSRKLLERALEVSRRTLQPRDPRILNNVNSLAMVYQALDDPRAGPMYEALLRDAPDVLGRSDANTLLFMNNAAAWYESAGNYRRAQSIFEEAARVSAEDRGTSDLATLWADLELGTYWRHRGEYDLAISLHDAVVTRARTAGMPPDLLGTFLTAVGKTHLAAHHYVEATIALREANELLSLVLGSESAQLASTRKALEEAELMLDTQPPEGVE